MKVSLIVTTYNRPDALRLVLASVARQSRSADETLVVDDGSDQRTAAVIDSFRGHIPALKHLWQKNSGFGAARVRNMGIAEAAGDYVVFIDGDMILDPHFVADHAASARPGAFLQGTRIALSEAATASYLDSPFPIRPRHLENVGKTKYLVRSPRLGRWFNVQPQTKIRRIHSCNQSFWRDDLFRVNGFEEKFAGHGGEDIDLCNRLFEVGVQELRIKFVALAYHLYHPRRANWSTYGNFEHSSPRAVLGLDQHLPTILPFAPAAAGSTRHRQGARRAA